MKFAILILFVGIIVVINCDVIKEEFKCVENVPYRENDCNNCFCASGKLGCTAKACMSDVQATFKNCEVGTTWKKDCNQCWCIEGAGTICTARMC
ncbi:hypothetical protein ILUMI_04307 [Ignelater luminosus]|uniref:Protease inhibitor n=1 Tax=Ignelater luminosus TaxID=2038154 RepID=A0A8K0D9D6_IGNLU|nr:hypothetical protein ILUMI_04307 [Ignelater luminosus]